MSENVVQPGIEPGSPDYRSDALTTRPLNQPRMLRVSFKRGSSEVILIAEKCVNKFSQELATIRP